MSARFRTLMLALTLLLQVTEEAARAADLCLRAGPYQRQLALQTARLLLQERGLQPPPWVLQIAMRLAWRRCHRRPHALL